jgi:serine/threonine protein kinase
LNCLIECKKLNILHRDFKPQNILINKTGEIKLCDFGESRIALTCATTIGVGTQLYWAPEKFLNKLPYDERSDVWSYGLTLAELVLGCYPYEEELNKINWNFNEFSLAQVISSFNPSHIIEKVERKLGEGSEFSQFLSRCLCMDVHERWGLNELKETNWYKSYNSVDERILFKNISLEVEKLEVSVLRGNISRNRTNGWDYAKKYCYKLEA